MNFMKYKWLYFLLSAVVILPGFFSLAKWGLRPAIDFTGGTILELRFKQPSGKLDNFEIEKVLEDKNISFSSVQASGEKTYLLRL
ncbi:hypothetical protein FJZ40_04305, partial [Candidatus Shapirobacteria bacterium]|nr:hypothetical protein [Candidatus Shapirobacteria bacterium]